jgi:hypothetical protein
MRKYYEGRYESFASIYSIEHYQELAREWHDFMVMDRDGRFADAETIAQSAHYAALFASMARYKMGLQD